jgi:hypothetical protein
MQNEECRMQNENPRVRRAVGFYLAGLNGVVKIATVNKPNHFAFCILISAFSASTEQGARMAVLMPWMIFLSAGQIVASTPPKFARAASPSPWTK